MRRWPKQPRARAYPAFPPGLFCLLFDRLPSPARAHRTCSLWRWQQRLCALGRFPMYSGNCHGNTSDAAFKQCRSALG
eukprot:11554250-Alexandrium_andersonii.AAC.1